MEFAIVKAGHDKGQIYLIAETNGEYAYLVNGGTKPFGKPKKKNRKHIRIITNIPKETALIMAEAIPKDQRLKKAIMSLNTHIYNQIPNKMRTKAGGLKNV